MSQSKNFSGVIAPVTTPFGEDGAPDADRFVAHAQWLMEDGCTGLAPFGTTSEANSLGLDERMELLEALVEGGLAPETLMPGTGTCSLTDTVILTRHAVDMGAVNAEAACLADRFTRRAGGVAAVVGSRCPAMIAVTGIAVAVGAADGYGCTAGTDIEFNVASTCARRSSNCKTEGNGHDGKTGGDGFLYGDDVHGFSPVCFLTGAARMRET